ncbi:ubiquinone/menaquinone biosynthesis methyltransferase [bacterium]|nr:ubiquinone/menaquinone biosynthesis methyltransferase [bacterium]
MTPPAVRDPEAVGAMFSAVAHRYDLVNHLMTCGLDILWRYRAVELAGLVPRVGAIDCACGTGDLAFLLKRKVGPMGFVAGVDMSERMLALAKQKGQHYGLEVRWQLADMLQLPYGDNVFAAATIGFGIRNLPDPVAGIREMARVVHPGGMVIVLEMAQAQAAWLRSLQHWYIGTVVTRLGGWLTGSPRAYRDFHETTRAFPGVKEFRDLMGQTGLFAQVDAYPQVGGMVAIYAGLVK